MRGGAGARRGSRAYRGPVGLHPFAGLRLHSRSGAKATLAGLEPAIFGSEDQRLIHEATGPAEMRPKSAYHWSCGVCRCFGPCWSAMLPGVVSWRCAHRLRLCACQPAAGRPTGADKLRTANAFRHLPGVKRHHDRNFEAATALSLSKHQSGQTHTNNPDNASTASTYPTARQQ